MSTNNNNQQTTILSIPIHELTVIKTAINDCLRLLTTNTNNNNQTDNNIEGEMIEKLDFANQIINPRTKEQNKFNQLKGASMIILSKDHCAPMSVIGAGKCGCPYQSIRNLTSRFGLSQDEIK